MIYSFLLSSYDPDGLIGPLISPQNSSDEVFVPYALIPACLLWSNHRYALAASIVTFSFNAIVLLLLFTAFRNTVAFQSVGAMSFRVIVWIAILALLWFRH